MQIIIKLNYFYYLSTIKPANIRLKRQIQKKNIIFFSYGLVCFSARSNNHWKIKLICLHIAFDQTRRKGQIVEKPNLKDGYTQVFLSFSD